MSALAVQVPARGRSWALRWRKVNQTPARARVHFDTSSELTKALGLQLTAAGPMRVLGNPRCKRFAMYVDNGIIKVFNVAEKGPLGEEDPAGDDFPEVSCIDNMLKEIKAL